MLLRRNQSDNRHVVGKSNKLSFVSAALSNAPFMLTNLPAALSPCSPYYVH